MACLLHLSTDQRVSSKRASHQSDFIKEQRNNGCVRCGACGTFVVVNSRSICRWCPFLLLSSSTQLCTTWPYMTTWRFSIHDEIIKIQRSKDSCKLWHHFECRWQRNSSKTLCQEVLHRTSTWIRGVIPWCNSSWWNDVPGQRSNVCQHEQRQQDRIPSFLVLIFK